MNGVSKLLHTHTDQPVNIKTIYCSKDTNAHPWALNVCANFHATWIWKIFCFCEKAQPTLWVTLFSPFKRKINVYFWGEREERERRCWRVTKMEILPPITSEWTFKSKINKGICVRATQCASTPLFWSMKKGLLCASLKKCPAIVAMGFVQRSPSSFPFPKTKIIIYVLNPPPNTFVLNSYIPISSCLNFTSSHW